VSCPPCSIPPRYREAPGRSTHVQRNPGLVSRQGNCRRLVLERKLSLSMNVCSCGRLRWSKVNCVACSGIPRFQSLFSSREGYCELAEPSRLCCSETFHHGCSTTLSLLRCGRRNMMRLRTERGISGPTARKTAGLAQLESPTSSPGKSQKTFGAGIYLLS
jgi:hypothetical protein